MPPVLLAKKTTSTKSGTPKSIRVRFMIKSKPDSAIKSIGDSKIWMLLTLHSKSASALNLKSIRGTVTTCLKCSGYKVNCHGSELSWL